MLVTLSLCVEDPISHRVSFYLLQKKNKVLSYQRIINGSRMTYDFKAWFAMLHIKIMQSLDPIKMFVSACLIGVLLSETRALHGLLVLCAAWSVGPFSHWLCCAAPCLKNDAYVPTFYNLLATYGTNMCHKWAKMYNMEWLESPYPTRRFLCNRIRVFRSFFKSIGTIIHVSSVLRTLSYITLS